MGLTKAEQEHADRHNELVRAHPAFEHRVQQMKTILAQEMTAAEGRGEQPGFTLEWMTRAFQLGIQLSKTHGHLPTYRELEKWDAAGRPEPVLS